MRAEEQDTPVTPVETENALLLREEGGVETSPVVSLTSLAELPTTEWAEAPAEAPAVPVEHLEQVEQVVSPPRGVASATTVMVPVEPMGAGIANLLTDAVGRVVKVAQGGAGKPGGATRKPKGASPVVTLRQGVRGVVADVGELVQNGAHIVTGLVDCLQQSMRCMGKVIMNPSRRPCQKPQAHNRTAPQASTTA